MNWENFSGMAADVILAADVLYDPGMTRDLKVVANVELAMPSPRGFRCLQAPFQH